MPWAQGKPTENPGLPAWQRGLGEPWGQQKWGAHSEGRWLMGGGRPDGPGQDPDAQTAGHPCQPPRGPRVDPAPPAEDGRPAAQTSGRRRPAAQRQGPRHPALLGPMDRQAWSPDTDTPQPPGRACPGTQASRRSTDPAGLSSTEALEPLNQRQEGGWGGVMLLGTLGIRERLGRMVRRLPSCVKVLNVLSYSVKTG